MADVELWGRRLTEFYKIKRPKRFFFGVVMIGLAFGFLKVLNQWVFLPAFPDVFDVSIIFIAATVFLSDAFK